MIMISYSPASFALKSYIYRPINLCRIVLFVLFSLASPSYAKDYKIEIIVFENLDHNQAYESYHYSEIDPMTSMSEVWEVEPKMLWTIPPL